MASRRGSQLRLQFRPLTPARWPDLEKLFGERGACGGCWCMWWRMKRAEFKSNKGEKNKRALRKIVESGEIPGIIAYAGSEPVGWCALAPRQNYPLLENSRVLARIDDEPVWSITCFFVAKPYRGRGVFDLLYRTHRELLRDRFDSVVTEVSVRNGRSLRAHQRVGFEELERYRDATDEWVLLIWNW